MKEGEPEKCYLRYVAKMDAKVFEMELLKSVFVSIIEERQPLIVLGLRKFITGNEKPD